MELHAWAIFASAYLATTISPGPNVLLVIRNSLLFGAHARLPTILGNLTSQLVIVVLIALGVGSLIAAFPPFFTVMKFLGAGYLIWLGLKQFASARASAGAPEGAAKAPALRSKRALFAEAFVVSSGNPKTLVFLSAFLPQFVDHQAPLAAQFATMYLTIATTVLIVHWIYAQSASRLGERVQILGIGRIVKRLGGTLFVGIGIKLAMSERP
ncbi:LysE family translocator [Niveibacterium sp. 24ML]|uniref:LysE family translocator n=1 Tax=Niveibacterium sp. 24ML TaxID=2985512 RepID=UPI002270267D|nr:LysE family translocator [Niveibacterium sp. 24ML]MCX9157471.1 LysE family translocator [Niveibacterium sp. 24ML]